tara:strand:+ start:40 stop:540 length:501 start_codon:yes stop_codon:yes gene_type:complete
MQLFNIPYSLVSCLSVVMVCIFLFSTYSISIGAEKCFPVRVSDTAIGQKTFEWFCVYTNNDVIYLAKSDNIKNCYTCFLKKLTDWTWEQEKRLGIREDPKYITCRRYKRRKAKNGQEVCLYKGANDTYTLVVEGQCPMEYQCKYDPDGKEPNINSVVDSLNESFKK